MAPDLDAFVRAERLGPDALALSLPDFRDLLQSRRGSVKSALMEQSLVAGIGNIYADEILFQARLDPRSAAAAFGAAAYRKLHGQIARVLRMAADRGAPPAVTARFTRSGCLAGAPSTAPLPVPVGEWMSSLLARISRHRFQEDLSACDDGRRDVQDLVNAAPAEQGDSLWWAFAFG